MLNGFFSGLLLILLGILAVPSLLLSRKPEARELLDKITPYQGWIGVVFCIIGLLNLRGRIVTAICLRNRLGCALTEACAKGCAELTAIGLDHRGEAYGLIVDAVGDVVRLDRSTLEPLPVNLDPTWAALAAGVHRLPDSLLVVLDLDAVLDLDLRAAA